MQKTEKTELYKIKKHRDLSFLLNIKPENLSQNILKYILVQGTGPFMNLIKIPITVYFSYEKYDYTGKFISRTENKSHSFPSNLKDNNVEVNNIVIAIFSMRKNQKSWFNIEHYDKKNDQCAGYHGYHYQITLEKFIYRNDNNYQSKKSIYESNRETAKILFQNKKFKDAIKIYKNSINILTALSKKFFSSDQLKQLSGYCEKSELNYLKCLAKMNGFAGRYDKEIAKLGKQIYEKFMKKNPDKVASYYQKAICLKYECLFFDAEQTIKEAYQKKFNEDIEMAAMEKLALTNMLESIKKSKQRHLRHLKRQEIRKKKAEKKNAQLWETNSDENWVEKQSKLCNEIDLQMK